MFGIGFFELIVILVVALLVVGPSRLPEVARAVGKALGEFKRMADDVKDSLEQELTKEEEEKKEETAEKTHEDEQPPAALSHHPEESQKKA